MKKKDKDKIRQDIGDTFDDWMCVLGLVGYGCFILFPEDEGWEPASTGGMSVKVKYPYKEVHLMIPQDYIDNYETKKHNIYDSLLHEAVHVLMWKFSHLAYSRHATANEIHDCEEELTDHIKSVIWKYANETVDKSKKN